MQDWTYEVVSTRKFYKRNAARWGSGRLELLESALCLEKTIDAVPIRHLAHQKCNGHARKDTFRKIGVKQGSVRLFTELLLYAENDGQIQSVDGDLLHNLGPLVGREVFYRRTVTVLAEVKIGEGARVESCVLIVFTDPNPKVRHLLLQRREVGIFEGMVTVCRNGIPQGRERWIYIIILSR